MDKKTTQFDQRLSEYRDRLLQRNKEMTTDDDDRIDAIINGSADTEEMEAPAGMNEIQEQSEASEKEDTQREPEPVSESYKEYADKLESVLQEVGVSKKPEKKEENKKDGVKIFPISAVSGKGISELLWYVNDLVKNAPDDVVEFEPEVDLDFHDNPDLPFEVSYNEEDDVYVIEGPRIERMLGYTNLESEKGFEFFQKFLKTNGILDQLEALGIGEGDTVRMYGLEFDYYK